VVSRALLAGRITTEQALDSMHQDVVSQLGHPVDLAAWCYLWEGHSATDYREVTGAELDVETRRLAAV
jgi:hypothetical protein